MSKAERLHLLGWLAQEGQDGLEYGPSIVRMQVCLGVSGSWERGP